MKSDTIRRLLRLMIAMLGAGVGVALTMGLMQLHTWTNPEEALPFAWVFGLYLGTAALGALIFFLLGRQIIDRGSEWAAALENRLARLTLAQLLSTLTGFISGLLIAALLSQVLGFMGHSMFTTAFSAILFLTLGALGFSVGRRRSDDVAQLLERFPAYRERKAGRKGTVGAKPKLLDASALIDGRVLDVCRTGFLEGELIVPDFVLEEIRRIAESSDANRSGRGRRGLDVLQKLREEPNAALRVESTAHDTAENDVRLLRMAQQMGAAILTGDYTLNRIASVSGVTVLNLNDLAAALRQVVAAGDELTVTVLREGKEPGQGVGYLDDGTMIVVEGGFRHVGRSVAAVVTSVLQTSAGRMIFTRLKA